MLLEVYLLYFVLQDVSGCTVVRGVKETITKSVGDSVVLPCSCTNLQHQPDSVQWGYKKKIIPGDYTPDYSVFPESQSQSQRYRGRVQRVSHNPPGDLSLIISHLTEEDEGMYLCGVSGRYSSAVYLYVRGCTVMDRYERSFSRSPGESVLLLCPCPSGDQKISPDRVSWSFTKPGTGDQTQTAVSNDTQSYRDRVWMFDQKSSRNFSLLISDLNKDDSGKYTCTLDDYSPYVSLQVEGCVLSENKQTVPIIRYPEESVLLSCTCTNLQDKPVPVQWRTPHHKYLSFTELHQHYSGRVQTFNINSPGNLSVLISDLTEEDGGTYSCWINQNQYRNFILTVKESQNQMIRYPGESVLLPCSCTDPHTTPLSVKWEHVDSGWTEISNETKRYTGRVQMFNKNSSANLFLLVSDLTEEDQGTYRCTINNKHSINITLNIKGCTLSEPQNQIIRYPGESVLLLCSCTDPNTRPVSVKWEHVDANETEISENTKQYRGRVQMFNKNSAANLSLLISNLTEEDQGTYRCTINNNQSINITLSIKEVTEFYVGQH